MKDNQKLIIQKPSRANGVRDFLPIQIAERDYLIKTISSVYEKYGFQKLETPVIEQLSVLTGKYGEEGDKLLFKILNSGEYLKEIDPEILSEKNYKLITKQITEKGLRYDLTVPLARYVVMNRNELEFPFKRYQIDKVWRADRPQKGRYREFYQCDADVIGSKSLFQDLDFIFIFEEVLTNVGFEAIEIKINNRKILSGIAEEWGFEDKFTDFTIAIDKLDKVGENGVIQELGSRGFSESQIHKLQMLLKMKGDNQSKINELKLWFRSSLTGQKGVEELQFLLEQTKDKNLKANINLDFTLARGLDYYTGTIYEVVIPDSGMGSIAGGGRYDNLTESFGVPDMPGIGISFGLERIYDILKSQNKLPQINPSKTQILIINFGGNEEIHAHTVSQQLREAGIGTELFHEATKTDKQFKYAEKKQIPFVLFCGEKEMATGKYSLKELSISKQEELSLAGIIEKLKN